MNFIMIYSWEGRINDRIIKLNVKLLPLDIPYQRQFTLKSYFKPLPSLYFPIRKLRYRIAKRRSS